jgi:hypothetical protein
VCTLFLVCTLFCIVPFMYSISLSVPVLGLLPPGEHPVLVNSNNNNKISVFFLSYKY